MQAEGDVDGADVGDALEVCDAGALQVSGGGGFAHIYPADGLVAVDEVHGHGLLGGDGGQPGRLAAQRGAADVVKVSDQQHRKTIHWVWGGGSGWWRGGGNQARTREQHKWRAGIGGGEVSNVLTLKAQQDFAAASGKKSSRKQLSTCIFIIYSLLPVSLMSL